MGSLNGYMNVARRVDEFYAVSTPNSSMRSGVSSHASRATRERTSRCHYVLDLEWRMQTA